MSKKGKKESDTKSQIYGLGEFLTVICFFFMIAFVNPFNPLPFMVSMIGFLAGLYLVVLTHSRSQAKAFRDSLLQKLDRLWNSSEKSLQAAIEKRKQKGEKAKEELPKGELKFCIYCGEKIPKKAIFCSKCGKKQE